MEEKIGGCIGIILGCFLSWAITVGITWLICLCFAWTFSLSHATGGWLVVMMFFWLVRSCQKG